MEKADLVHLTFPLPFDRSRFPCPVVATIHDLYPYDYPDNFGFPAYFLNRVFLKVCVSQADALCCVSGYTRDRTSQLLSDLVSDKPLLTTGNIVELSSITPAPPKWMDSANPGEYLLSVAQHRKNKRLDLLINAFAVLKEREDLPATTRLIIVGSHGPETPKIMSLIQSLRLSNSVFLISGVTDNELAWLYQNAQALIITSSIEGFCIPLIEALKYHTRVVCSDIPILREIGRNSCQYFNSVGDSTEALVSAIIFSLSSPRASSIDLERFSVGNLQPIYLELYSTLVL
jgi:glycosyltransferase involved in cell wall biosynthesis